MAAASRGGQPGRSARPSAASRACSIRVDGIHGQPPAVDRVLSSLTCHYNCQSIWTHVSRQRRMLARTSARRERVVVVGAGIGRAGRRARSWPRAGCEVTVLERAAAPGGKMREVAVGGARSTPARPCSPCAGCSRRSSPRPAARFADHVTPAPGWRSWRAMPGTRTTAARPVRRHRTLGRRHRRLRRRRRGAAATAQFCRGRPAHLRHAGAPVHPRRAAQPAAG